MGSTSKGRKDRFHEQMREGEVPLAKEGKIGSISIGRKYRFHKQMKEG